MKTRVLLSLCIAIAALVTLPFAVSADTISVSGVGPTGVFGPVPVSGNGSGGVFTWTQSNPIASPIAYGTFQFDDFTFSLNSNEPPGVTPLPLLTLSGEILATNGVCLGGAISTSCIGLYVEVTAADPGSLTSLLNLSVEQSFASPYAPGTAATVPLSDSLYGACNTGNSGGSVSLATQISPSGALLPTLSANCNTSPVFGVRNPMPIFTTLTGGNALDISQQISFNLDGGSITLPTGTCVDASSCSEPDLTSSQTVPEPSSLALFGSSALGLIGFARKRIRPVPRG
jgi:hypothetical protein